MKKRFLLSIAVVSICASLVQAATPIYERRAFEGRYGLWADVQCMADSLKISAESDDSLLARYPVLQMEADAKASLARLGFPKFCNPKEAPAPATMVSLQMEVRAVMDENEGAVYFVRLLAAMPDGDFARTSYGQHTQWESSGALGQTSHDGFRGTIRRAMADQIEGFASFMDRTRRLNHD